MYLETRGQRAQRLFEFFLRPGRSAGMAKRPRDELRGLLLLAEKRTSRRRCGPSWTSVIRRSASASRRSSASST
jgi:hypothetical protein